MASQVIHVVLPEAGTATASAIAKDIQGMLIMTERSDTLAVQQQLIDALQPRRGAA